MPSKECKMLHGGCRIKVDITTVMMQNSGVDWWQACRKLNNSRTCFLFVFSSISLRLSATFFNVLRFNLKTSISPKWVALFRLLLWSRSPWWYVLRGVCVECPFPVPYKLWAENYHLYASSSEQHPEEGQRICTHKGKIRKHGAVWAETISDPLRNDQCTECSCTVRCFLFF